MAFENVDYKSLDIPAAPFSDPSIIPDFPKNKVPRHVGVIMDGNGRWAQQRGLIRTDGHQAAEPVVFDTIAGAIETIIAYARNTFDYPVVFYTGSYCEKENYPEMASARRTFYMLYSMS